MRPSFFIFSLPRSGSSWLSVFLTGPDSFCYHIPTADRTPLEWRGIASQRPEKVVGAVDTMAYIAPQEIIEVIPKANFFTLVRDPRDIDRSSRWHHVPYDAFKEREVLDSFKFEKIIYSHLGKLSYLEEIWGKVIGTPFDAERAKHLIEMRIERDVYFFYESRPSLYNPMDLH